MRIMLMYAILPALPLLFFMLIPAISRSGEPIQLFPGVNAQWTAVNDSVMGGRSKGGAEIAETGLLRFEGVISLENRGGFSSIRSNSQDYGLPGNGTIVLRLRGANRGYFMDLGPSPKGQNNMLFLTNLLFLPHTVWTMLLGSGKPFFPSEVLEKT